MTAIPYQPAGQNPSRDQAAYFDGYYNVQVPVSGAQYDAVIAFFLVRTQGNRDAATSLATALLEITHRRGIDPMQLLDQFKRYSSNESFKNALLSLFNSSRPNTSRIGYARAPDPSPLVVRNVRP